MHTHTYTQRDIYKTFDKIYLPTNIKSSKHIYTFIHITYTYVPTYIYEATILRYLGILWIIMLGTAFALRIKKTLIWRKDKTFACSFIGVGDDKRDPA